MEFDPPRSPQRCRYPQNGCVCTALEVVAPLRGGAGDFKTRVGAASGMVARVARYSKSYGWAYPFNRPCANRSSQTSCAHITVTVVPARPYTSPGDRLHNG